jgi:hypothetical protein
VLVCSELARHNVAVMPRQQPPLSFCRAAHLLPSFLTGSRSRGLLLIPHLRWCNLLLAPAP